MEDSILPTQVEDLKNLTDAELHLLFLSEVRLLRGEMKTFNEKFGPMFETYTAAMKLGKWGMAAIGLVAILIGIFKTLKELMQH